MIHYNFDVVAPEFTHDGIAKNSGWIKVYNIDPVTREYIGANYEYVAKSTGLASGSYTDMPKQPPVGYALCRSADNNSWIFVTDNRGKKCYNITNGQESIVTTLGDLDETHTFLPPETPYDVWINGKWEVDLNKQQEALVREATQKRLHLLELADRHIEHISSAIDANDVTDIEQESLADWQAYRRALARLDTSKAPNIEWPINNAKFYLPQI